MSGISDSDKCRTSSCRALLEAWYGPQLKIFALTPQSLAGKDENHCLAYVPGELPVVGAITQNINWGLGRKQWLPEMAYRGPDYRIFEKDMMSI